MFSFSKKNCNFVAKKLFRRIRHNMSRYMATTKKITAYGTEISVLLQGNENDYICLTDMARYKDKQRTDYIIQNWLRSRSTIEYLGVWEQLYNPSFNPIEFDGFRNQAGLHSFSLTPKEWMQKTNAIGIYSTRI